MKDIKNCAKAIASKWKIKLPNSKQEIYEILWEADADWENSEQKLSRDHCIINACLEREG